MACLNRGWRRNRDRFSVCPVPCPGFVPLSCLLALWTEPLAIVGGQEDFRASFAFLPDSPFLALLDLQVEHFAGKDRLQVFI